MQRPAASVRLVSLTQSVQQMISNIIPTVIVCASVISNYCVREWNYSPSWNELAPNNKSILGVGLYERIFCKSSPIPIVFILSFISRLSSYFLILATHTSHVYLPIKIHFFHSSPASPFPVFPPLILLPADMPSSITLPLLYCICFLPLLASRVYEII